MDRATYERVMARSVEQPDGCIVWQGATTTGYGVIRAEGRLWLCHRVVYLVLVGPIPDGWEVDHLCRNRACVRVTHLEAVPKAENNRRSDSRSAVNARKTHCLRGHPLSGDNLYERPSGGRECRTCHGYKGPKRRATHCKRGHPLDGENVRVNKNGSRQCRLCVRIVRAAQH